MSDRKINIGILGSGGYGATACRYLNNTGQFQIVACMDIDAATARTTAVRETAKAYSDLNEFLAHPGMEAVCINTPVLLHADHTRFCLEASKHVFVTKPVTAFIEDGEQIAELAARKKLALVVGHHARHTAMSRFIKTLLETNRLGRLCNVLATCCSGSGLCQKEGDWRADPEHNPGGPLLQCGIHTVDTLMSFFGPISHVMAMMQDNITDFSVVDNTLTLMQFASGIQACFICNYTTAYMHTMDFFGTEGNLHVHEHVTDLNRREVYFQLRRSNEHEPWESLDIPKDSTYPDSHGGVLEKDFAWQIRSGRFDYGNLKDSIAALSVIHAAVQSHRTGTVVGVEYHSASTTGGR
ncbi:MAG: Gfo/Idh/MocA family oxidoreductase [Phycisphaerae bacterium]